MEARRRMFPPLLSVSTENSVSFSLLDAVSGVAKITRNHADGRPSTPRRRTSTFVPLVASPLVSGSGGDNRLPLGTKTRDLHLPVELPYITWTSVFLSNLNCPHSQVFFDCAIVRHSESPIGPVTNERTSNNSHARARMVTWVGYGVPCHASNGRWACSPV